jgi:hypothetical protein
MNIIGRHQQIIELEEVVSSPKSELVAILGRRRVGKTFLIRNYFSNKITFDFTGIYEVGLQDHMARFSVAMGKYFFNGTATTRPANWYEAFDQLDSALSKQRSKKKKILVFDELPWMGMSHISFKKAFNLFWNNFATSRTDIVVLMTGSSTAWMHNEVFRDKGGLFQRVTRRIHLAPFTLYETELYAKSRNLPLNKYALLDLYMIFGGIPFYLDLIRQDESVVQCVDRLFFRKNAELKTEFHELFKSLFNDKPIYKDIVHLLAKHQEGLLRNELALKLKLSSGGQFSAVLDELESAGFIKSIPTFGNKKKERKYKLLDAYTLFYHRFVKDNSDHKKWTQLCKTQNWISWSGIAFENTCFQHIPQIKEALKIGGIISQESGWHHKGSKDMHGAQIDLLIDRDDKIINLCEMKYYNNKVIMTNEMAQSIRSKMASFTYYTQSKKSISPIMISPFGLNMNQYSNGLIYKSIDTDDLFWKVE